MEWIDIGEFENLMRPHALSVGTINETSAIYYDEVLVYGPTWEGRGLDQSPHGGMGEWTGEPEIAIAWTHFGLPYFIISSRGPSEYDDWIKPTHFAILKPPA
jgi:hypothetical protein